MLPPPLVTRKLTVRPPCTTPLLSVALITSGCGSSVPTRPDWPLPETTDSEIEPRPDGAVASGPQPIARNKRPSVQAALELRRLNPARIVQTSGPETRKPALWVSHSAGFAIRSPRGIGEPHDIAPRGS